jgi:hypothetical protein
VSFSGGLLDQREALLCQCRSHARTYVRCSPGVNGGSGPNVRLSRCGEPAEVVSALSGDPSASLPDDGMAGLFGHHDAFVVAATRDLPFRARRLWPVPPTLSGCEQSLQRSGVAVRYGAISNGRLGRLLRGRSELDIRSCLREYAAATVLGPQVPPLPGVYGQGSSPIGMNFMGRPPPDSVGILDRPSGCGPRAVWSRAARESCACQRLARDGDLPVLNRRAEFDRHPEHTFPPAVRLRFVNRSVVVFRHRFGSRV